jgi:hypothetical protein
MNSFYFKIPTYLALPHAAKPLHGISQIISFLKGKEANIIIHLNYASGTKHKKVALF